MGESPVSFVMKKSVLLFCMIIFSLSANGHLKMLCDPTSIRLGFY